MCFYFFHARVYIFGVDLYPWKWYFEPYRLCVLSIQKNEHVARQFVCVEKNYFFGYYIFWNSKNLWKNAPTNIFDDTSIRNIHFWSKFFWNKYCFEFQPIFGPNLDQFFMKNEKFALRLKMTVNIGWFWRMKRSKNCVFNFVMLGYIYLARV